jgi:hypothetical protein
VNWDDGTTSIGTVTEANGNGTCTASKIFAAPGVYSVTVIVNDDDTGTATLGISQSYVVVFDPNAGFVTGGGFVDSPTGACTMTTACTVQTGKANFGFVSKYKKGSNTPEGETEFQFHAGDLKFKSSAYEVGSLVISSFKAQYKGTGAVNGVPGYRFILTAYDGAINGAGNDGIDKFRIRILDSNNNPVYDNGLNASNDIDMANPSAISGGSIVIHKAAK